MTFPRNFMGLLALPPLLSACQYVFGPLPVVNSLTVSSSDSVLNQCGAVIWDDSLFDRIDPKTNPAIYTFAFSEGLNPHRDLYADELTYVARPDPYLETRDYQINMLRSGDYSFRSALRAGAFGFSPVFTCQKSGFSVSTEIGLAQGQSARINLEASSDGHLNVVWTRLSP